MFDFLLPYIGEVMSSVSRQGLRLGWEDQAQLALQAGLFLVVFTILFFWWYRKHFWQTAGHRRLLWWTVSALAFVVIAKVAVFAVAKGYIPDRLFFYGIPSPKFSGLLWLLPTALALGAFWCFERAWGTWPAKKFIAALFCIFVLFSAGIAGLREGAYSIYEPFTRTYWEYTGALPLIESVPQFLREYTDINAELPVHSQTHPPVYVLFLYAVSVLFGAHPMTLALAAVVLGGLALIPIYYFLRAFAEEKHVRRGLALFIFVPSFVLYSATSMETALLFWSSASLAAIVWGWRRSGLLAFAGGVFAAAALFQSFLFLLFAPLFLFLALREHERAPAESRSVVRARVLVSLVGFAVPFFFLEATTGYSIIDNFFVARAASIFWVSSNFESLSIYLTYAVLNLLAFGIGFGMANTARLLGSLCDFLLTKDSLALAAVGTTVLFLAIGIFQGEVERIWLFLLPLCIIPLTRSAYRDEEADAHLPLAALSAVQVVFIQTIFYTYW